MTAPEILKELKPLGSDSYKKILLNHGVVEPCYGVKVGDLKKIQKRIKKDYALALALYDTGHYDAMYLAGLIADDARMTKKDLRHWVKNMKSAPLAGCTVPWVAAGSPHGHALALEWIDAKGNLIAEAGWATLSCLVAIQPDEELDLTELRQLLQRVQKTIHQSPDNVRYAMNNFVISVAVYVHPLTDHAIQVAEKIGQVEVDMGHTACQVPFAPDYIQKCLARNAPGKKRKTVKC